MGARSRQAARPAEYGHTPREAIRPGAGQPHSGGVEIDVAGHKQVQPAIAIVVYERAARTPVASRSAEPRSRRRVRKSAIAIVVVKNIPAAVVSHEQIVETVVI